MKWLQRRERKNNHGERNQSRFYFPVPNSAAVSCIQLLRYREKKAGVTGSAVEKKQELRSLTGAPGLPIPKIFST
ncbi:hypothetical protein RRG08_003419 [Elysia crispata]|uniref:Uncharacterized protein n=1 Tax=Elysia crispata TaxID=231223 RepID=A0AAE1AC86_9GAST|nr:hypothetical protein RRG08_003419 [Elysia crispata]